MALIASESARLFIALRAVEERDDARKLIRTRVLSMEQQPTAFLWENCFGKHLEYEIVIQAPPSWPASIVAKHSSLAVKGPWRVFPAPGECVRAFILCENFISFELEDTRRVFSFACALLRESRLMNPCRNTWTAEHFYVFSAARQFVNTPSNRLTLKGQIRGNLSYIPRLARVNCQAHSRRNSPLPHQWVATRIAKNLETETKCFMLRSIAWND